MTRENSGGHPAWQSQDQDPIGRKRRTKRDISHVFAFIVIAVASCGGNEPTEDRSLTGSNLSGAGVLLTTERSSYPDGASVKVTIQNQEPERLGYNACTRELEVWEGTRWVAGPASLRLCNRRVYYVDAGATLADSTDIDLGLVPGEYRMVFSFAPDFAPEGQRIRAASNSFTITP